MLRSLLGAAALIALSACGGAGASSGHIALNDKVTTLPGLPDLTIGDVLSGGNQNAPQDIVFQTIPDAKRCRTIRPRGPALVVNINAYEGENVSRDRLWWTGSVAAISGTYHSYEQIEQAEIIVTETERPVFLILGSYESVLWKIHAAPGVQIDGVVAASMNKPLITGDVEADRVGFISRKSDAQKDCAVYPSNSSPEKAKRWNKFMINYLRKPKQRMYSYRVNAALVGPVPTAPVDATAIFNDPVYIPEADRDPVVMTFNQVRKIMKAQMGS